MPRSRRCVLQTGAVAAATGLAGCFSFGGTNETIGVDLENEDSITHELAVSIAFDEDSLFERTTTLDTDESTSGSFENPDSAGSASVEARLDEESPTTKSVRVGPGTGIRSVTISISETPEVGIWAGRT
jgi:hypothetical protein